MDEDLLRGLDVRRHAHRRPPDAVKLEDVLADQVVRRAPAGREGRWVAAVAGDRQVVDQRVVPDVEDVPAVPGHRHAPGERRAGDGDVAQASPDEPQRLVALGDGTDEVGVAVVVVEQALLERAQLEEVVVLLHLDHGSPVHGAVAVDQLVLGVVVLARDAVEARVRGQLDEPVVVDPLEELLHDGVVPWLGGADEVVVGDVEPPPGLLEAGRRAVRPLLRGHAVGLGRLDDLGPVLVGARHEPHVVAQQPVPARQGVGVHRRVRRAHVRCVVDVVDRRGQVVGRHRR